MSRNREIESILESCLERLEKGDTIEQCLASFPAQAGELGPALRMAQMTREASSVSPRPDFRARARYEFHSALQEVVQKRKRPAIFGLKTRLATVMVALSIVLVFTCGTVVMASNSMPDNPLYVVKLASEEAQLVLTPSDVDKARVCVMQVDRRVDEIVYLADKGDAQKVDIAAARLDDRLEKLVEIARAEGADVALLETGPGVEKAADDHAGRMLPAGDYEMDELRVTVVYHAASNQSALVRKLIDAPESVKPALHRAISVSTDGYGETINAIEETEGS